MSVSDQLPAGPEQEQEVESIQDRIIDSITASQQEVIETFETTGHTLFEGLTRTRQEIADFLAERIRQDFDTQQALLRCRSYDEVREVQARFLQTALDQYGSEATRLIRLGGELATRGLERTHA
jgi:hypothetical protein